MIEYKVGLRLISRDGIKGVITGIKEPNTNPVFNFIRYEEKIIISWYFPSEFKKDVQYTKTMLDECFSIENVRIDKEWYRNEKLNILGV